jgi:hypothetical protein
VDAQLIENLQTRTEAKLRYADVQLVEIEKLPGLTADDFERSHQEGFLFHLKGAFEAFLAEINCYYSCGLKADGISPGKLREKIKDRTGSNAAELVELRRLETLDGEWLAHAEAMRDHSTHQGGVPRVIYRGGELDGQTHLRNPITGAVIEKNYPIVFREWLVEAEQLILRLRASALAQNPPATTS